MISFQSRLSVEETVKSTNKLKKNSTLAANYDETEFVCNIRILTELCVNGMNDLASKVCANIRFDFYPILDFKGFGLFSVDSSSSSSIKTIGI